MLLNKNHLNKYEVDTTTGFYERVFSILAKSHVIEKNVVFLSHKHDETVILKKVVELIHELKANVYIDWEDDSMPVKPNNVTDEKIK